VKVFLDTNVVIDVLARRTSFYEDSAVVWTLAEQERIEGIVSAVSFTNVFYIVRKLTDDRTARRALVLLRNVFTPAVCDGRILNRAIDSKIKDFEDAVQYFSAVHAGADCMLSRNPDDFRRMADCPVLTPAEFLAAHDFS
jgi:predicted nucleic acid-binding protein